MCRPKNLHFTLGGACTHLDHLAAPHAECALGESTIGMKDKENVGVSPPPPPFLPPSLLDIKGLYQFRGYLENLRQTKTRPPPAPPPIQSGWTEKRGDRKRNGERKKALGEREAGVWMQASTRRPKKGRRRRKEVNEKRAGSRGETLSSDLNWVYVFTQAVNNSAQGAWPRSTHTHTIKWEGRRRQFQSRPLF